MTAATAGELERPPLKIEVIQADGEKLEIKLTYGLFQDMQRYVPDPGALADTIVSNPFTRDFIIRRCLTPLKGFVKDPETDLIDPEAMTVEDPDELDKILQWATGHLLYFFAISAGGLKQLSEVFSQRLAQPVEDQPAPSTTGSKA